MYFVIKSHPDKIVFCAGELCVIISHIVAVGRVVLAVRGKGLREDCVGQGHDVYASFRLCVNYSQAFCHHLARLEWYLYLKHTYLMGGCLNIQYASSTQKDCRSWVVKSQRDTLQVVVMWSDAWDSHDDIKVLVSYCTMSVQMTSLAIPMGRVGLIRRF